MKNIISNINELSNDINWELDIINNPQMQAIKYIKPFMDAFNLSVNAINITESKSIAAKI